ncbi:DUF6449 domain-containing protein [Falsibacillus pallidus]|uniref:ABC-2 type transport system permease protein n=1 Tax=Falsibacillus pallidus TaxID=493781 RepID=A0A370GQA0_9BACI|nr:DUF6449 domain-containing protein [Falsibacillus pallidus]RDI45426.1 ABC-2 type transport system permease protein [Falsibacillus pallidus]
MSSKISWINKELLKQINRSIGWVGIIYLLALLFALPLEILMLSSRDEQGYYRQFKNLFEINADLLMLITIIVPIGLSIFLFRYLQVKQTSDLIHSLPMKREKIFYHYSIAGILYLIIPVLLTGVVLLIQYGVLDVSMYYQPEEVFIWMGITSLINIVLFTAGAFVGMLTGLSAVQGVLTYIFVVFPAGILILFSVNLKYFLLGFPREYFMNKEIEKYSPLTRQVSFGQHLLSGKEVIFYIIIAIILYFASLWIYKKRKLEGVSQALAFPFLKPIFKYCVSFCVMMLGGAYFGAMQDTWPWIVFGYAAGALVGYILAEMLIQKSWRITFHWKGLGIYIAAMLVLGLLIHFDVFHYEKKLPEASKVERVHISQGYYDYLRGNDYTEIERPRYLAGRENIKNVIALHKAIVSHPSSRIIPPEKSRSVFIAYELKNGKKLVREYRIEKDSFKNQLSDIYSSEEYKKTRYDVLNVDNGMAEKITFSFEGPFNRKASVTEPEKISKLMELIKSDILNQSYEDMENSEDSPYQINILLNNDKTIYVPLSKNYSTLINYLKQEKIFQEIELKPEDISSIMVAKDSDFNKFSGDKSLEQRFEEMTKEGKVVKIDAESEIKQMIDDALWSSGQQYVVAIHYKGVNDLDIRWIGKNGIPERIIAELK